MKTITSTPSPKETIDQNEDTRIYIELTQECPEGQIILNEQEKADFESWLGV